jgi:O-phospho-L-seryl-tRNASec:L-selenocysteinyl-tRNA synthase
MTLHALKIAGYAEVSACLVVPMATGMSLVLTMLALRNSLPLERRKSAQYVLWPRIDQKTCYKAIITAGFIPIIVEMKRVVTAQKYIM